MSDQVCDDLRIIKQGQTWCQDKKNYYISLTPAQLCVWTMKKYEDWWQLWLEFTMVQKCEWYSSTVQLCVRAEVKIENFNTAACVICHTTICNYEKWNIKYFSEYHTFKKCLKLYACKGLTKLVVLATFLGMQWWNDVNLLCWELWVMLYG
jgi:hypothetical protein